MQVVMQTKINPPTVVYDSEAPEGEAKTWAKKVIRWLYPAIQVQQDGVTIYKTRDFYEDNSEQYALAAGLGIGAMMVGSIVLVRLVTRR